MDNTDPSVSVQKIDSKTKHKRIAIGLSIVVAVFVFIFCYFIYNDYYPSTDDAYVGANLVNVAPKESGYLQALNVMNDQKVSAGQVLFSIDRRDYDAAYQQAQKSYLSQKDMVPIVEKQLKSQQDQLTKDLAQYKYAQSVYERYAALYKANTVAKQDYQQAQSNYVALKSQVNIDKIRCKQAEQGVLYSEAKRDSYKAQMDAALLNLQHTDYLAPVSGYITNMTSLTTGEYLSAGQQLFGLVDDSNWWVDANFKETQLSRIKVGQKVKVELDMYDHVYEGVVESISHASGTTFSLLPAQNATGNWVTQRFTVRIKIVNDPKYPLRVGASATVKITTI